MKHIYLLPWAEETIVNGFITLVRRPLKESINNSYTTFHPIVWRDQYGNWWLHYNKYAKCDSKEDGMRKVDELLIADGAILIEPDRVEKLRLLL
jgi:hypothetical protein